MMKKITLLLLTASLFVGFSYIQGQLLFASFHIKAGINGDEITLIETLVVNGNIKRVKPEEKELQTNHLKISLLNSSGELLDYRVINHPLRGTVEYIDENKALSTAKLNLTETEFFVRMPYSKTISKLKIELIGDDLSTTEIKTIILK